jgi:hypothetical protein
MCPAPRRGAREALPCAAGREAIVSSSGATPGGRQPLARPASHVCLRTRPSPSLRPQLARLRFSQCAMRPPAVSMIQYPSWPAWVDDPAPKMWGRRSVAGKW